MEQGFRAQLREKLVSELAKFTEGHICNRANAVECDPGQTIADRIDHSAMLADRSRYRSLAINHKQLVVKIEAAIKRVDENDDSYGQCDVCEAEIPVKRMEAAPWASKCLGCEERQEAGSPHIPAPPAARSSMSRAEQHPAAS